MAKDAHDKIAAFALTSVPTVTDATADKVFFSALAGTVASQIPIVAQFFDFFQRIDDKLRQEKLNLLLQSFASRFARIEDAEAQLHKLFAERGAAILTRKLVQILDRGDTDEEWIDLLANVLKTLSEADIEKQFEEISYTLALIERLSPQAVILLGRFDQWRSVRLSGTTTTSGETVCGDWDGQVTKHLQGTGIRANTAKATRIAHAFRDLKSAGLVALDKERVILTPIGDEIFRRISQK